MVRFLGILPKIFLFCTQKRPYTKWVFLQLWIVDVGHILVDDQVNLVLKIMIMKVRMNTVS